MNNQSWTDFCRGIRPGVSRKEALTYLVQAPHSVVSGKTSRGEHYVTWGWCRPGQPDSYITLYNGVVRVYHGITPDIARVAMPI